MAVADGLGMEDRLGDEVLGVLRGSELVPALDQAAEQRARKSAAGAVRGLRN